MDGGTGWGVPSSSGWIGMALFRTQRLKVKFASSGSNRVLVVEDNIINQQYLAGILKKWNIAGGATVTVTGRSLTEVGGWIISG